MRFVLGVTVIAGLVASSLFAEPPSRLEGLNLGRDVLRDQESKLLAQGGRGGQGGGGGRQGGGFGGGPGGQGVPPGGFGGGQGGGGHGQGGRGPGGAQSGQGQGGAGLQAAQNGLGGNLPLGMQSRPCEVMPAQLQAALNLTADQRQQLDQIQQEVDARVAKVLNDQQLQQLRQMGVQVGAQNRGNRPPQNPGGQQVPPQRQQQQ